STHQCHEEGDGRDDIAREHAKNFIPGKSPREKHYSKGSGHEQLVRDRVEKRSKLRRTDSTCQRTIEQIGHSGDHQDHQPVIVVLRQHEPGGERETQRSQRVGRAKPRCRDLLGFWARTTFGHSSHSPQGEARWISSSSRKPPSSRTSTTGNLPA